MFKFKDNKIYILKNIPKLLSLFCSIMIMVYLLSSFIIGNNIGRPSSTSSVIIIFIPIYMLVCALIGYFVGLLVKKIFTLLYKNDFKISKFKLLFGVLIFIVIISGLITYLSYIKILKYEELNSPKILSNKGFFTKKGYDKYHINIKEVVYAKTIWKYNMYLPYEKKLDPIILKLVNSEILKVYNKKTTKTYIVSDYSYITQVDLLKIPNSEFTVILLKLRATSFRSILLVYDAQLNLLYEELLERCNQNPYLAYNVNESKIIINQCGTFYLVKSKKLNTE